MTFELIIPKLGVTMTEGKITRWTKSEGDWVETGDDVLEIETDKVTYEMEAPGAGYLRILHPEGATLPVGTVVGLLFEEKSAYEAEGVSGVSVQALCTRRRFLRMPSSCCSTSMRPKGVSRDSRS